MAVPFRKVYAFGSMWVGHVAASWRVRTSYASCPTSLGGSHVGTLVEDNDHLRLDFFVVVPVCHLLAGSHVGTLVEDNDHLRLDIVVPIFLPHAFQAYAT